MKRPEACVSCRWMERLRAARFKPWATARGLSTAKHPWSSGPFIRDARINCASMQLPWGTRLSATPCTRLNLDFPARACTCKEPRFAGSLQEAPRGRKCIARLPSGFAAPIRGIFNLWPPLRIRPCLHPDTDAGRSTYLAACESRVPFSECSPFLRFAWRPRRGCWRVLRPFPSFVGLVPKNVSGCKVSSLGSFHGFTASWACEFVGTETCQKSPAC